MKPENLPENLAPTSTEAFSLTTLKAAFEAATEERYRFLRECEQEAWKWKTEGDMYGWNFHMGMGSGANQADLYYARVGRAIDAALAQCQGTPPDVSPPNEKEPSAVSPAQHDEGYVLCPVEPTDLTIECMCVAGTDEAWPDAFGPTAQRARRQRARRVYKAAISAAQPDSKPE